MGYITLNRFARTVKREMRRNAISLRQLAAASGISPAYLSLILSGDRNPPASEIVEKIAKALDMWPPMLQLIAGYLPRNDRRLDRLFRAISNISDQELDRVVDEIEARVKMRRQR